MRRLLELTRAYRASLRRRASARAREAMRHLAQAHLTGLRDGALHIHRNSALSIDRAATGIDRGRVLEASWVLHFKWLHSRRACCVVGELNRKWDGTQLAPLFPKPRFRMCILYVDENLSVERQLFRGRQESS